MIGVDTSFLVGLAIREHPSHEACLRLLDEEILEKPGTMVLAAQVLTEFCHVVTDPRRFERPLDMTDALELSEAWWHAEECTPVAIDAEAGSLFLTWMHEHRLGRKRLLDTLLAATYFRAGVTRLATTDWRDFEVFDVFEIEAI